MSLSRQRRDRRRCIRAQANWTPRIAGSRSVFDAPSNGLRPTEAIVVMGRAALLATASAVPATFVDLQLSSRSCGVQLKGGHPQSPLRDRLF
jgi:hypothetical protein